MALKTWSMASAMALAAMLALPAAAQDAASAAPAAAEAPAAAATHVAARTVWDGVFTEEQAERGHKVYNDKCSSCHNGGMHGPSLTSGSFRKRWDQGTLDGLFMFIHDNMPAGAGGTLTDKAYLDVMTYILKRNKFPAGETELTSDLEALGAVTILATKPE